MSTEVFILTIRNDGLGDLILSLPTLSALRRRFPDVRLGAVVNGRQEGLFELYSDRVEVWPDGAHARGRLRRERPDVALFLSPDPRWAGAACLAGVPRRIGTGHRWQSLFFNERADVHRRDAGRHEAECNLRVAASLGIEQQVRPLRLTVPEGYRQGARATRAARGMVPGEPYVVLHPGSRGSSPNWPAGHYAELARMLADRGVRVLVTGSPSESRLAQQVAGTRGCTAGETDLGTLAAHLDEASTVVAGSTGPLHLAAVLGVTVVGLYSSKRSHAPVRWGPLGGPHVIFQAEGTSAEGTPEALSSIEPSEVAKSVEGVLSARRAVP